MNLFLKLNGISAGYAFICLVFGQCLLYGMSVVKPLGLSHSASSKIVVGGAFFLAGLLTLLCMRMTKNWMQGRMLAFWAVVLWFPYWILFSAVMEALFPGEDHAYVVYVMTLILTPFYPIFTATAIGISALWHESAEKKATRREAENDVS
ncbi:hypothetical protein [Paenibacillus sp. UNC499MF]|uniref:hypothetical protein n=1 Tax=Paenibacillus sp. UNC499MF TaxID=1502751 RepID=UPI00089FC66F|nr:hypothetical protein [Paenibacillus sp. UNC499MF]SEF46867.1 hypothetical protein SAMN02799616_00154 [Paenibacillus sp. UNC499MF]